MRIGITPGMGIGPELLERALSSLRGGEAEAAIHIFNSPDPYEALMQAIYAAQRGEIGALVTGPVSKDILRGYPGQTELLHENLKIDSKPPLMVFIGGPFILGLATVHVSIRQVSEFLTRETLTLKLERLIAGTAVHLGLPEKDTRVTVLGLNPHAGENGLLGDEESRVIEPVIRDFQARGYQVTGPVSADGFWGYLPLPFWERAGVRGPEQAGPHAVMAMMHDQGLGPYKLLCQGKAANLTWGLKIPRASPAHGTADHLVGTGLAKPDSFVLAIQTAMQAAIG